MNALLAGRYRLGGLLGSGGSAEVLAAHDELLDRPVAVKLGRRPGDRTIAVQARATARLDHPRIVRVLDTGELDGRTWAVLERVDGASARDLVATGGPLAVADARAVALAVLAGLEPAHAAGVRHGDLSPGNVLVPVVDGSPRWALARLTDLAAPVVVDGRVVVSPHYAAPEVAAGGPWDARADLYALGAVLVHLLTGAPPFDDGDPQAVLRAQVDRAPDAPSARRRDVPPALDAVVLTALAKDPSRRYPDAAAMAQALRVADGPGASGATAPVAPPARLAPRPRVPQPVRGTRPMPPVGATAGPPAPAVAQRRGAGWALVAGLAVVAAAVLGGSALARPPAPDDPPMAVPTTSAPGVTTTVARPSPTPTPTRWARVPDLVGATLAGASAQLAAAGLAVGPTAEQDGPAGAGTVLGCDPVTGTRVLPGAVVALVVASGVTVVPTVAGLDRAGAGSALASAGLAVAQVTLVATAGAPAGTVIGTLPGEATRLAVGGAVRLLVAVSAGVATPSPTTSTGPGPTPTASATAG